MTQLINRGADLLAQGDARHALSYLLKAWELDPGHVATAINLAGAYILLGRHAEAIPILEAATSTEPGNAMIWMNLGAAYLGKPLLASEESQQRATAAFERALELQPNIPNVNYNLGLIYRDRKNWAAAREQFERALAVNPADRDAETLLEEARASEAKEKQ